MGIVNEKAIHLQTAEKERSKETMQTLPHLCALKSTEGEKKGEAQVDIKERVEMIHHRFVRLN